MSAWQLIGARCYQAAVARDEFTKLAYESTFTKYPEGTSFVNAQMGAWSPLKYHAGQRGAADRKPPFFQEVSEKEHYVKYDSKKQKGKKAARHYPQNPVSLEPWKSGAVANPCRR